MDEQQPDNSHPSDKPKNILEKFQEELERLRKITQEVAGRLGRNKKDRENMDGK